MHISIAQQFCCFHFYLFQNDGVRDESFLNEGEQSPVPGPSTEMLEEEDILIQTPVTWSTKCPTSSTRTRRAIIVQSTEWISESTRQLTSVFSLLTSLAHSVPITERTMNSSTCTAIATVLDKHAPIVTRVITVRPKTPLHTEDLSRAKRELRCAERRWQKTRLVVHRQIFTTLRNAYHQQLAATKSNHYRTIIHESVNNVKAMYSVTNDLLGRSASPRLPDCRDDARLAEEFHHYFTQKIGNIRSTMDSRWITITIEPLPPTAYQPAELCEFQPASADDIKRIIVQSSSKSCELDPMPTNLLKDNIDTLAPIITDIVNKSLQSGVIQAAMKHAIVTPIIKKSGLDANLYMNYRPISSLSFVSKTLECYVALELRRHLDDKCLNDPFQSAYRPGHSTETALVRIHNDLLLSIDSRRSVLLVLLEQTAAFDMLDHPILLNRLRELGADRTVLAWFTSYLVGRSNSVKIRQTTSSRQTLKYGVPQGSVLGPILFNIYTSPIADIFGRHQIRYHIYADDTQLYAECPPSNHTAALRQLRDCMD